MEWLPVVLGALLGGGGVTVLGQWTRFARLRRRAESIAAIRDTLPQDDAERENLDELLRQQARLVEKAIQQRFGKQHLAAFTLGILPVLAIALLAGAGAAAGILNIDRLSSEAELSGVIASAFGVLAGAAGVTAALTRRQAKAVEEVARAVKWSGVWDGQRYALFNLGWANAVHVRMILKGNGKSVEGARDVVEPGSGILFPMPDLAKSMQDEPHQMFRLQVEVTWGGMQGEKRHKVAWREEHRGWRERDSGSTVGDGAN